MGYYIYILECSNSTYYTGYTSDIKRRYQEHLKGTAKCKYTRSFPPRKIIACWEVECSLSNALKIEAAIKSLDKTNKKALIAKPNQLYQLLKAKEINDCLIKQS